MCTLRSKCFKHVKTLTFHSDCMIFQLILKNFFFNWIHKQLDWVQIQKIDPLDCGYFSQHIRYINKCHFSKS